MTSFANRHGTGSFRRRHLLDAPTHRTIRAAVEDEMHHFEIVLHHDGEVVTGVDGDPIRWPWSPCRDSPEALVAFVGLPLAATPADIAAWTDARQQCTHQFDLTALAVAHAARQLHGGDPRRDYVTEVPDWDSAPFTARLWRNGELSLEWTCEYERVIEPAPFRDAPLRRRFFDWCAAHLDAETTESAHVLRRAIWMSPARKLDLESFAEATGSGLIPDICFTAQPHRMPVAIRNRNSLRDYSHSAASLLAAFDAT